jgi:hypothetical protein
MRKAGCGLAIVGMLLCAASLVTFGTSLFRALAANEAHSAPVAAGEAWMSGPLTVDTAKLCQIAVRGLIRSPHAKRGSGENADWDLQYAFPLRYTVFDGGGVILQQQSVDFASDGGARSTKQERVTEAGGSAHIEQGFAKFEVPAPGEIRVEATLGPDVDFGATIEAAEVVVYDNVSKHARRIGVGVALLIAGGGLAMLGFTLVIIAAAKGGSG